MGSALVILMLLFDPFLQQVVAFPSRFVPAKEGSTIFRAQRYVARNEKGLPLPSVVDLSMKSAIYNGIFDEQQKAEFDITHSCPSGNCTWPTFSSLAICNKCVDISSHIRRTCNETGCHQLSLPEGPSLSYSAGQINSSVTNISSSLGGIYASVVRFSSLIIRNINESDNILAVECSLWYCVQSYHTSVELGKLSQKVQSSWRNDSARLSDPSDLLYNPPESIINPSLDPTSYRVSSLAARALNSFTSEMVTGSGGLHKSGPAFSSDIIQALYRADSLATRIANLATSMTNDIRSQSNDSCGSVSGTAWVPESYVQVRWWWFSYPLIIATLSLIFLISSVIETARCKLMVWKSNNLIILFLGRKLVLDQTLRELSSNELSEVNEQIQDIKTQLSQTDDRTWQLT